MGQPRVEVLEEVLLALIAGRWAGRGDWERALQVAETIPDKSRHNILDISAE